MGQKKTLIYFARLCLLDILFYYSFLKTMGLSLDFWALTITAILTGWLIFKSKWEKDEYYYFLLYRRSFDTTICGITNI